MIQYVKTTMQSKTDFFIGLSGFLISQAAGLAFLYLVFEQIPSMQEWTLEQMLFIYGFAQLPRGIDHLLTDNIWMVGWQMVIKGTFDKYILRPMNIFSRSSVKRFSLTRWVRSWSVWSWWDAPSPKAPCRSLR